MLVPLSWLKEYVDIDISAQELETKLFSCVMVIIGIQYFHDIFCKVLLLYCFVVISALKRI